MGQLETLVYASQTTRRAIKEFASLELRIGCSLKISHWNLLNYGKGGEVFMEKYLFLFRIL